MKAGAYRVQLLLRRYEAVGNDNHIIIESIFEIPGMGRLSWDALIGRDYAVFLALLALTSVSRTLERVADHATNISKDVIYLIEGDIVRHRSSQYREKLAQAGEAPNA